MRGASRTPHSFALAPAWFDAAPSRRLRAASCIPDLALRRSGRRLRAGSTGASKALPHMPRLGCSGTAMSQTISWVLNRQQSEETGRRGATFYGWPLRGAVIATGAPCAMGGHRGPPQHSLVPACGQSLCHRRADRGSWYARIGPPVSGPVRPQSGPRQAPGRTESGLLARPMPSRHRRAVPRLRACLGATKPSTNACMTQHERV